MQKYNSAYAQASNLGSEVELNNVRETIQQLLRWGWKYNKNLEEQAAQLHMLTAWSQIVEVRIYFSPYTYILMYIYSLTLYYFVKVSASRRLTMLEDRSEILFQ